MEVVVKLARRLEQLQKDTVVSATAAAGDLAYSHQTGSLKRRSDAFNSQLLLAHDATVIKGTVLRWLLHTKAHNGESCGELGEMSDVDDIQLHLENNVAIDQDDSGNKPALIAELSPAKDGVQLPGRYEIRIETIACAVNVKLWVSVNGAIVPKSLSELTIKESRDYGEITLPEQVISLNLDENLGFRKNFYLPGAVATTAGGMLAVADTSNRRVMLFNRDGVLVNSISMYFVPGLPFPPNLNTLTAGSNGFIWMIDRNTRQIHCVTEDGHFIGMYSVMDMPGAVCCLPDGALVVASAGTNIVYVYDHAFHLTPRCLQVRHRFGGRGSAVGQFDIIRDIAVTPQGNLLLVDPGNGLQMFTPDGQFLQQIISRNQPGGWQPVGVAMSPEGYLAVTEVSTTTAKAVAIYSLSEGERMYSWTSEEFASSITVMPDGTIALQANLTLILF